MILRRSFLTRILVLLISLSLTRAIDVNVSSTDSLQDVAKTLADSLMAIERDPDTPGTFVSPPYFWWASGAAWAGMVDYWFLTGDDQYNDIVQDSLMAQISSDNDYMPPNQTRSEGNSDQAVWALAALTAAERSFPTPTSDNVTYLSLAQNVFDEQSQRWDTENCDGGLRFQIFAFNNGYNYKDSISNGAFFQLASRLAQFTGNQTYAEWAERAYSWGEEVGFIDDNGSVFDGANIEQDCGEVNKIQWTMAAGLYLYGSAVMYNLTSGSSTWRTRTSSLLDRTASVFFANDTNIMFEVACETEDNCNTDQKIFKAFLARYLARTAVSAPMTVDTIMPLLESSAQAAAESCTDGDDGAECAASWIDGTDQSGGLGEILSAMEVVQANLVPEAKALSTVNTTESDSGSAGGRSGSSSSTATASGTVSGTDGVALSTGTGENGAAGSSSVPFTLIAAAFMILLGTSSLS